MSDFVSCILDELVPTFSEEAGDWERVVADAGAETPTTAVQPWPLDMAAASAAPRRRHGTLPARWLTRRRLVAVAVAALLAALLVTPALGLGDRLLSLIQGKQIRLDVQAPAWSPDGRTIVFVSWSDGNGEIYAMDADSSSPRNLTQDPAQDVRPAWSPNGRRIAFVTRRDGNSEVYVMNADGGEKRNLTRDRANDDFPTWSPDGRKLAFVRGRLHGNPVPGLDVRRWDIYRLYVVNADGSGLRRLSLRVPEGTPETTGPQRGGQLVWSADGRTIYFGRYLVRTDGSGARRLPYIPLSAVWSPDGRRIASARTPDWCRTGPRPCYSSQSDIYVMNADGSETRKLTHNARQNAEPAWSPDGRRIAFRSTRNGNRDIYVMNADGTGKRNLTRNAAWDSRPSWSPDGRTIAFVSNRDGRLEAHVMNADGSGQRSLAGSVER
jgi:Tol biopolymer transport system component